MLWRYSSVAVTNQKHFKTIFFLYIKSRNIEERKQDKSVIMNFSGVDFYRKTVITKLAFAAATVFIFTSKHKIGIWSEFKSHPSPD